MSIASIAAIGAELAPTAALSPALAPVNLAPPADTAALAPMGDLLAPGHGTFDGLVSALGEIDARIAANGRAATELALGQADNLHQVMIASERTRLQFELAMSMRNRVLEAYQEIMRMQV